MSPVESFKVGDEVNQLGRTYRLTEAGWRRINPHTGGVSLLTPVEAKFFGSAERLAREYDARTKAAARELAERALVRTMETP